MGDCPRVVAVVSPKVDAKIAVLTFRQIHKDCEMAEQKSDVVGSIMEGD